MIGKEMIKKQNEPVKRSDRMQEDYDKPGYII